MKKVKLIGKKVISVGLAASLLLVPVSTNRCSAYPGNEDYQEVIQNTESESKAYKAVTTGVVLLLITGLAYYGYSNKDVIGTFIEENEELLSKFISENKEAASNFISTNKKLISNFASKNKESITKFISENRKTISNAMSACKKDIMGLMSTIINVGKAVGSVGYAGYDLVCSVCKLAWAFGPRNILSVFGGVSIWNKGKGAYNKAKAWFKSEPKKEKSGVQNFNLNLKIS